VIRHDLSVIPAQAGIQVLREGTGFRVKPGMTMSRLMCAGSIVRADAETTLGGRFATLDFI